MYGLAFFSQYAIFSVLISNKSFMARTCDITGKGSIMGGGYSNRVRATKFNPTGLRRRYANLQTKTYLVPELNNQKVKLTVSTKGMRTIAKKGIFKALKDANIV
jgi:ribosomal protein L28